MVTSLASMPVGYRFQPTDEELINHYLKGKIDGCEGNDEVIPEIDLCGFEPWDLPEQSAIKTEDLVWFFFSPRNRKYPNGKRCNRATRAGFWKVTGKDRPIKSKACGGETLIGLKRSLVFYRGRASNAYKTVWIMHEYRISNSSSENAADEAIADQGSYVLCRLFKQPGKNSPNQNSIEAEGRVLSEMPSNHTNTEFGTQEDFCEYPVDEVDSTAQPAAILEGSNWTAEPVDIDDLGAEVYGLGRTRRGETVSDELPVMNSNDEFLNVFPQASHLNSCGFENYESEELIEYLDFHGYHIDEVDSTALPAVIQEGSNLTVEPVDVDDLGAELYQTSHLNSCGFENYESEEFTKSLFKKEELTKSLDFHEYAVDEVDSTALPAMILEGSNLTAEPLDIDDLGAEFDLFFDLLCGSEEPEGGETVSDELPMMNSNNEFLDAFPQTSHLNSCGFENYESEELTKYLDSVFVQDDHPCGLNYDINGMLINPGMDNTQDNQIPGEDSDVGIADLVPYLTSSLHNLRKIPSKNPVIEHSWANGYAVMYESLSEGSGKQDGETGIKIRSRQTKAPSPDFDYELQCSAPTRIQLMKSQPMQVESLKDGEILRRRRLASVAIVLATLVLVLVSVGWKWISG